MDNKYIDYSADSKSCYKHKISASLYYTICTIDLLFIVFAVVSCASTDFNDFITPGDEKNLPISEHSFYCGESLKEKLESLTATTALPLLFLTVFCFKFEKRVVEPVKYLECNFDGSNLLFTSNEDGGDASFVGGYTDGRCAGSFTVSRSSSSGQSSGSDSN